MHVARSDSQLMGSRVGSETRVCGMVAFSVGVKSLMELTDGVVEVKAMLM